VKIQNSTNRTFINSPIHKVEWPVPNVLAFTTTRLHPENQHDLYNNSECTSFSQFNLGDHVGDNPEQVKNNRNQLLKKLSQNSKIQWLEQIHGNKVVTIDTYSSIPLVADAAITKQKNIGLAVMTADCLPILLTAVDGSEIAAIHGGWKPLAKNIIANTVNRMYTSNDNIIAWLGPCIGATAFEVGEDVKLVFESQSEKFISAFSASSSDEKSTQKIDKVKYLADLGMIAKIQLTALGINQIWHLNHCTYTDEQQYFSYRRDNVTGRMASIIIRT
jgi:YfiH family protein